jgi:hypothetical protein
LISTPAASIRRRAKREITALRSGVLSPFICTVSNAMVSCRGVLTLVIGNNAFFTACLRDDILVISGPLPESMLQQETAEITKSGDRDLRRARGERRAHGGVEHPRRYDNADALLALNEDDISPAAPLGIK